MTYWVSSRNIGAIYPGLYSELPRCSSVFIGRESRSLPFLYNPFELYRAGVITSPNLMVFGQIGYGKSALVKAMLSRHLDVGFRGCVLDPKGEYRALSSSRGGTTFSFGKGPGTGLNPLSSFSGCGDEVERSSDHHARLDSLGLTFSAIQGRELTSVESLVVAECLGVLEASRRSLDLFDVYETLMEMREKGLSRFGAFAPQASSAAGEMALELRRYLFGDLTGVIDGRKESYVEFGSKSGILHVDLLRALRPEAMRVGVPIFLSLLSRQLSMGAERYLIVLDEAWLALASPGCIGFFRSYWKLARGYGISNIAVVHRSEDLSASGEAGTVVERVANGLVSDSQTFVIFHLDNSAARHLGDVLGLSSTEVALISTLPRGRSLWKVAGETYLVDVMLTQGEQVLFDTDQKMG